MTTTITPTIADIITATGWPTENWKGECYAVAISMVEKGLIDGKPEYGIWKGLVAPGSYFDGRPIIRHGWIRLPNNQVCDPTRWVFEDVDPYLYIGPDDDYDMGAADLRATVLGYDPASETEVLDFLDTPDLYADATGFLHKLANTPPKAHPFFMAEVYETIDQMGHNALIPIDYQNWAGIK